MLKRLSIISIILLFALATHSHAESEKAKVKGPITITSVSLTADNKGARRYLKKCRGKDDRFNHSRGQDARFL
jgi:hypothetical protein